MLTTKLSSSASLLALLALCGCATGSGALDEPPPTDPETPKVETAVDEAAETDAAAGAETDTDEASAGDESAAPTGDTPRADAAACDGGVVLDDGGLETGYGFVPSARWGRYLQAFDSTAFQSRQLDTVCVCWLRTRPVDRVEFEVVFHRDAGGRPAEEPYATRPAVAEEVPRGKESGGRFYAVDVSGVEIPEGPSYIGVRFDPGAASFFFVCADQSPTTEPVPVYQQEDAAPSLAAVMDSPDPIFWKHAAMMLRAKAKPPEPPKGSSPDDE